MKKIGFFGLLILWSFCFGTLAHAAMLSPAISVMQNDVEMIKTGVGTNTVSFSEEDFETLLGTSDFKGITVSALPDAKDGILKLGTQDISLGQTIGKEALAALRFIPTEAGKTAAFRFLPLGAAYENPFVCTVYMLDSLNFAPSAKPLSLSAKETIPVYASLSAEDPEGDTLTYHLVSEPKYGKLRLSENGEFSYIADEKSAGKDSFSFYAADRYGNQSKVATVSIETSENKSGILYSDLIDTPCALPAAVLAEKGAFVGEKLGDEWYFHPEKTVTRADFLMMAMQMCEIDTALIAADDSGFADSDTFTAAQNRYIATAKGLGFVVGLDTQAGRCFCPSEPITSEQAATILGRLAKWKGLSFGGIVAAAIDTEGTISDDGLAMLAGAGLVASDERKAELTREDAAKILYTFISYP